MDGWSAGADRTRDRWPRLRDRADDGCDRERAVTGDGPGRPGSGRRCRAAARAPRGSPRPPSGRRGSPTTRAFMGPSAVMEIAPGSTPGNLVAGCPSTGTSHSVLPLPVPSSTSRSSASYQVRAIGSVMLGPSWTGCPMDDGPVDVRVVGFCRWPGLARHGRWPRARPAARRGLRDGGDPDAIGGDAQADDLPGEGVRDREHCCCCCWSAGPPRWCCPGPPTGSRCDPSRSR